MTKNSYKQLSMKYIFKLTLMTVTAASTIYVIQVVFILSVLLISSVIVEILKGKKIEVQLSHVQGGNC